MKTLIKKILNSHFLKDRFVWSMVFLGILFNLLFFLFIKYSSSVGSSEFSFIDAGYDFLYKDNMYDVLMFSVLFFLTNLFLSKILYMYDVLVSYMILSAIPFFNFLYFLGVFVFISSGSNF